MAPLSRAASSARPRLGRAAALASPAARRAFRLSSEAREEGLHLIIVRHGQVHRVVRRPLPRCRPARPRTVSAARHPHADDIAHLAAALHRRVSSWPRDANVAAMAAQQGMDWTPLGFRMILENAFPAPLVVFCFSVHQSGLSRIHWGYGSDKKFF